MTVSARDQILQRARAKAKRMDTLLAWVAGLTDDEAEIVYAKLEERVVVNTRAERVQRVEPKKVEAKKVDEKRTTKCGKCHRLGHNARTCPGAGQPTKEKRPAKKTSTEDEAYADKARKVLAENPQGLRTYEIGKKIGQSVPNVFGTLKLLERLGDAERHGSRNNTLWTKPGVKPVVRVQTIAASVVHVLANAKKPMDTRVLRDAVVDMVTKATGNKPRLDSVTAEFGRLHGKNIITTDGANEHGPLYVLVKEGGADSATLN